MSELVTKSVPQEQREQRILPNCNRSRCTLVGLSKLICEESTPCLDL